MFWLLCICWVSVWHSFLVVQSSCMFHVFWFLCSQTSGSVQRGFFSCSVIHVSFAIKYVPAQQDSVRCPSPGPKILNGNCGTRNGKSQRSTNCPISLCRECLRILLEGVNIVLSLHSLEALCVTAPLGQCLIFFNSSRKLGAHTSAEAVLHRVWWHASWEIHINWGYPVFLVCAQKCIGQIVDDLDLAICSCSPLHDSPCMQQDCGWFFCSYKCISLFVWRLIASSAE